MIDKDLQFQIKNMNNRELCSLFTKACSNGEVEVVSYMLDDTEINNVLKKYYHDLGFKTACNNGQVEIVKIMINDYDDLNIIKIQH